MATTHIDDLSIKLSGKLKDRVSVATTNGRRFTAQQRLDALNQAGLKLYQELLQGSMQDKLNPFGLFVDRVPEFVGIPAVPTIVILDATLLLFSFSMPTGSKYVFDIYFRDGTRYQKVPLEIWQKIESRSDPDYEPSTYNAFFSQRGNVALLAGITPAGAKMRTILEFDPTAAYTSGTDIQFKDIWDDEILKRALVIAMEDIRVTAPTV